ncbi:Bug family tripartite tricarboxylate transporter substrate binding protein [Allopusillimonas ginsengisoli]|uniref:Bug family tripartite tricarboxylate transporter substrate binding protein n=1 Tax=Allopusillimonas ginsengisoli TaxID=453575 RepID=UPI001FD668C8|nr:tripartite tricarboxylate transporter substrate binding protein [Allopusillimonas ginsengisoli]
MKKPLQILLALAAGLLIVAGSAMAYPDKPVRIIVPWPAGGGADYVARALGKELSALWKQSVIVENVGGAGSIIGAEKAARSAPDGYTVMLTINGTITSNRFLYKTLPYDPDKSFIPVSMLVQSGQLILVNSAVKAKSMEELVDQIRSHPNSMSYASYGKGTQPNLLFELLKKRENIDILHVPYKGLAPALTAVMANEVQMTVVSPSSATGALNSGRAKPVAIGSESRSSIMPDVPTVKEAGFPYMAATIWFGLFAPAGTPASIVDRLQNDISTVIRKPDFSKSLEERGFDVVASNSTEFSEIIQEETARTAEMADAANVRPE